jgi:hypothetical protein
MPEGKSDFNPEPWVRSLLWLAIAVLVVISFFQKDALKIAVGSVVFERGGQAVPGDKALSAAAGTRGVQRDPAGTTYVSICPPKTRAVGGSCTILKGGGSLQNFGPEQATDGGWQFVCVWGSRVEAADAQAVCLAER